MIRSVQRIYAIKRVDTNPPQYAVEGARSGWSTDITKAHLVSRRKFDTAVRVDLGLDLADAEMIEVVPSLKETK